MSTAEEALAAARDRSEYRAGVWAFRAMLVIAAVLLPNIDLSFLPRWTANLLMLAFLVIAFYGNHQLRRAGVSVSGMSKGSWSRRGMVYRDVLGLGRR
ncbi:hypothetical protein ACIBSW_18690 [Actinoplanes sp. NPDC049668]|uniref:hypothetical protein n=1 Tax=unclassified Actinoplanes TaxID=2626549 RepID=UPI0033A46FA8